MEKVSPEPNSGCWLWDGLIKRDDKKKSGGYGFIRDNYTRKTAHRVSWTIFCGEIPEGMSVLHKCDVRCCVNPEHLYLGTHEDNMRDMSARNRAPMHRAKVSKEDVLNIRREYSAGGLTQRQIAEKYGLGQSHVSAILREKYWRYIRAA